MKLYTCMLLAIISTIAHAEVDVYWIDGDTLQTQDNRKYRLANVDTPELDQPYGREAQRLAAEWTEGRAIGAYATGAMSYGRVIADICDSETWPLQCINDLLVEAGMAWVDPRYNTDPNLVILQEWAREHRLGLWEDPNPIPPWEWRKGRRN